MADSFEVCHAQGQVAIGLDVVNQVVELPVPILINIAKAISFRSPFLEKRKS